MNLCDFCKTTKKLSYFKITIVVDIPSEEYPKHEQIDGHVCFNRKCRSKLGEVKKLMDRLREETEIKTIESGL